MGGSEAVVREAAHGLAERGYEVEVLTTCALDHYTWANVFPPGHDQRRAGDGSPFPDDPVAGQRSLALLPRAALVRRPAGRDRGARLDQRAFPGPGPLSSPLGRRGEVCGHRVLALPVLVHALLHGDRSRADDPHALPARRAVRLPPRGRRRPGVLRRGLVPLRARARAGPPARPGGSPPLGHRRCRQDPRELRPARASGNDTTSSARTCSMRAGARAAKAGRS